MSGIPPIYVYPLLGADDTWSAFRIETCPGATDRAALAKQLTSPLLGVFDHRFPWLLPALPSGYDAGAVAEHAVTVFPAHPDAQDADALKELEASLRLARRKVALTASPDTKLPAAGTWDYLLIGCSHARSLPPFTLIGQASRTTLVATDVHTHNDREWVLGNACTLSTCEFLLTRSTPNSKADITRMKLLKLLTLIADDADTGALDTIFREEPKLSYSLLRLVNSAALSPGSPITSFSQAITLLGRRQLQRWLQLLVYSDPNNGQHPNPLLQKAAARGRLFELLAEHIVPPLPAEHQADTAFMIGTFSLLDVLLGMAMPEILRQLPLPEVALKALVEHEGGLGQLLSVITAVDKHELKAAAAGLDELGIDGQVYFEAQLEAYGWASKIHPA